ncbi:MAG: hypothetical protein LBS90_07190 [Oscillospiraceae bacterium]|jgi:hypothetical protein|nr:hypothetical protein [Oscillospiraceae bacterium]
MKARLLKTAAKIVYCAGTAIVLTLSVVFIFGAHSVPYPRSMMAYSWREIAFLYMAFGSPPMLAACCALYGFCGLRERPHRKRSFVLVFIPGFICAACALYIIGIIIAAYVIMILSAC